jgi:hypothetical protein
VFWLGDEVPFRTIYIVWFMCMDNDSYRHPFVCISFCVLGLDSCYLQVSCVLVWR